MSTSTQISSKLPNILPYVADKFRSACISSVLRTYYTWKIVTSPDITYHMVQMGLWTYAELATGVIVSCLPVIPKFFQYMGPRITAKIFNQAKLSGDYKRQLNPRADSTKEAVCGFVLPFWRKSSRLDRSETLSIASSHRAYLHRGDYISEEFEIARSENNTSHDLSDLPLERPAKTRNNLGGSHRELWFGQQMVRTHLFRRQ